MKDVGINIFQGRYHREWDKLMIDTFIYGDYVSPVYPGISENISLATENKNECCEVNTVATRSRVENIIFNASV